jgi:hypothetical protein
LSRHGWVTPNPDGSKARCGGPALCTQCALEAESLRFRESLGLGGLAELDGATHTTEAVETGDDGLTVEKLLSTVAELRRLTYQPYYPTKLKGSEYIPSDSAFLFESGLLVVHKDRLDDGKPPDLATWLIEQVRSGAITTVYKVPEPGLISGRPRGR